MPRLSRRSFLKILVQALLGLSGALGLGGLLRFLSFEPDPPPPARFDLGPASDYLPDSHTVLPAIPAVLYRNQDGFRLVSLTCTHLGCTLQVNAKSFTCPCHGTIFDQSGAVLHGPAVDPLPDLRLELTSDGLLVAYKD